MTFWELIKGQTMPSLSFSVICQFELLRNSWGEIIAPDESAADIDFSCHLCACTVMVQLDELTNILGSVDRKWIPQDSFLTSSPASLLLPPLPLSSPSGLVTFWLNCKMSEDACNVVSGGWAGGGPLLWKRHHIPKFSEIVLRGTEVILKWTFSNFTVFFFNKSFNK